MFFSKPFPVRPRKAFLFLLFQVKLKGCFIEGKKNDFQQNTSQIVSVSKMAEENKYYSSGHIAMFPVMWRF